MEEKKQDELVEGEEVQEEQLEGVAGGAVAKDAFDGGPFFGAVRPSDEHAVEAFRKDTDGAGGAF